MMLPMDITHLEFLKYIYSCDVKTCILYKSGSIHCDCRVCVTLTSRQRRLIKSN